MLSAGTEKQLRLHWTLPDAASSAKSTERYASAGNFDLPPLFWEDLSITLGAVVTAAAAEILGAEGRFIADRLKDLLPKTETLLRTARQYWNESAWAQVALAHAHAAAIYGEQAGDNDALAQAVSTYQHILNGSTTREKVPLAWAMTQNNLGNALRTLGERESGTTRLEAAVRACEEALKEYTREKVPLAWATTQYNLGVAFCVMGERLNNLAMINNAIGTFNIALPIAQSGSFSSLVDAILGGREKTMLMLERRSGAGTEENGQESKVD